MTALVMTGSLPAFASTCTTSAQYGECSFSPYEVQNNVWNAAAAPGWTQTLTATSASDWSVSSDMPGTGTTVISYPDSSYQFSTPEPLADVSRIPSSYDVTLPSGTFSAEAAYDIWLNAVAGGSGAQEIMIWTDNHGQTPAGTDTKTVYQDPETGADYTLWDSGNENGATVTLVANTNETSGSINILDAIEWLVSNGVVASGPLAAVDYGFEIASTDGTAQTFAVDSYSVGFSGQPNLQWCLANGATSAVCGWAPIPGDTYYQYEVLNSSGVVVIGPAESEDYGAASWAGLTPVNTGTYTFQMQGCNSSGCGSWSNQRSFTTT